MVFAHCLVEWGKILHSPSIVVQSGLVGSSHDALYVACAYCYLFGFSERLPMLAGDEEYISGGNDLEGDVRLVVRAA